jgi:hypothetical protein
MTGDELLARIRAIRDQLEGRGGSASGGED